MQKGFATLELIIVIFIVVLLAGAAVPNAVRIVDKISLDYETKRLYTDLRAVQAFDRMTNMNDSHFTPIIYELTAEDEAVNLAVEPNRYTLRKNSSDEIYAEHYFSNGVAAGKSMIIKFDDMGKVTPAASETLELTSRFGKRSIVFDSVGRFRGGRQW